MPIVTPGGLSMIAPILTADQGPPPTVPRGRRVTMLNLQMLVITDFPFYPQATRSWMVLLYHTSCDAT